MESGTVIAILPCNDLDASERFYGRLGFVRIERPAKELETYRMLSNGKGRLHLTAADDGWLVRGRNPFGLYFYMEEVDFWAAEFRGEILGKNAPENKPWGTYEFAVLPFILVPCPHGGLSNEAARGHHLLGAAAAFWPFVARAQQPPKLRTIGFLGPNTAALDGPRVSALVQRLRELGWIEGSTIAIVYRWAEGRNEHLAEIAAEFVRLKVDVIVTSATPTTVAVKKATSSIPVVFASVGDPIGAGLVASLARPGANVTGLSLQMSDTAGKKLGIIRAVVPGLHHVAATMS